MEADQINISLLSEDLSSFSETYIQSISSILDSTLPLLSVDFLASCALASMASSNKNMKQAIYLLAKLYERFSEDAVISLPSGATLVGRNLKSKLVTHIFNIPVNAETFIPVSDALFDLNLPANESNEYAQALARYVSLTVSADDIIMTKENYLLCQKMLFPKPFTICFELENL